MASWASILAGSLFATLAMLTLPGHAGGFEIDGGWITPVGNIDDRSAWAGSLQLCDATVEGTRLWSKAPFGKPSLDIKLRPAAVPYFVAMTERLLGQRLLIRLDGVVISSPVVMSGSDAATFFEVSGPDRGVLLLLAERVREPCPGAVAEGLAT